MRYAWGLLGVFGFVLVLTEHARGADGLTLMSTEGERTVSRLSEMPASDGAHSGVRLTLYWENDGGPIKLFAKQDRHYTAGAGMSLTYRSDWVDAMMRKGPQLPWENWGEDTRGAMGIVGALTIYTPEKIAMYSPDYGDRPYAGWTYGGLFFQRAARPDEMRYTDSYVNFDDLFKFDSYARFESLEVDLGIMGPSSLAQNAQEMVHHTFDYVYPHGWNNQIHDELEFSIKYNRRWRSKEFLVTETGIGWDVIPDFGVTLGSLENDLTIGAGFRFGILPDDFGPGDLAHPADFTRPNDTPPYALYVFGRPYGRFVAHNALLQGDNWRHNDPVTKNPLPAVFGTQFGAGVAIGKYFEIAYIYSVESYQFSGQQAWDCWCSLQASFTYCW